MPTDPNARRDQVLSNILGELKKITKLLENNSKMLDKIERNTRPSSYNTYYPYLERVDSGDRSGTNGPESDVSTTGSVQGGDPTTSR